MFQTVRINYEVAQIHGNLPYDEAVFFLNFSPFLRSFSRYNCKNNFWFFKKQKFLVTRL